MLLSIYLLIVVVVGDVDSVDRIQIPYMWDGSYAPVWMLGWFAVTEPAIPVERIAKTYPQAYPQKRLVFRQSTSWRNSSAVPIFRGLHLWIFLAFFRLLHSEGYLSTKNRDLSTNLSPKITAWGISLPLNIEARLQAFTGYRVKKHLRDFSRLKNQMRFF